MFTFTSILVFLPLLLSSASGFCIYNDHTDNTAYWMRQTAGYGIPGHDASQRFTVHHLGPGLKQCCHYSTPDCNATPGPFTIVHFAVQRLMEGRHQDIFDINCPSGGYIVFSGTWDTPVIQVFNSDHTIFPHSFQWKPDNVDFHSK